MHKIDGLAGVYLVYHNYMALVPGIAVLAQSDSDLNQLYQELFWPVTALVIASIVTLIAVPLIRRWTRASDLPATGGFTLEELRKLKKSGAMSDEEFARMKSKIAKVQTTQFLSPSKPESKPNKQD